MKGTTMTNENVESWVENLHVVRITKGVQEMLQSIPPEVNQQAKMEITDRRGYVQVLVVCTFRIPSNKERG